MALGSDAVAPQTSSRPEQIIVIGPTPPPIHGVAFTTPHVIASLQALGKFAAHLDPRDERPVTTTGRLDLRNVQLGLLHAWRLLVLLRRHPGAAVYLPLSQVTWGFLRDAVFVWLARLARRGVYVHLNGGLFRSFYEQAPAPMRVFIRATLKGVREAWVLTPAHTKMFEGLVPHERVRMLENAVDDPTRALNGKSITDGESSGKRVLYLSNLVPEKGCFDLLAAFEAMGEEARGVHLRLVGEADPDVADEVRRRAAALADRGVEVELAGVHLDAAKARDYAWADVFTLPSRYPPEGQPLVLLEAMAASLPIVTTDHSGIPHTVRDEIEGLIVPPGDVDALRGALERVIADAELRERLGRAGRRRYDERYTPDAFRRRVAELV